jgi:photosystem II stability/assembly factor-like uncharacterized protein
MNSRSSVNKATYLVIRIVLFALILTVGTFAALAIDETTGLASTTLPANNVEAIATDPSNEVLYAGLAEAGETTQFYISKNNGQSWQMIGTGLDRPITDLAVHPADSAALYAGTKGGNIDTTTTNLLISSDGGQEWHDFHLTLPANVDRQLPDVTAIAVDPNRPDELYIGTAGQGIYLYDAQPGSYGYELVGGVEMTQHYVKDLVVGPESQIYALTTEGMIVIDRANDTWRIIDTLPDVAVSLAIDPTSNQTLYAGTAAYGAYRSTDGGQTWESLNNEAFGWQPGVMLRVSAITIDDSNPAHVALATAYNVGSEVAGGSVYESTDAGQNWTKVIDSPTVVNALTITGGGLYGATAQGLIQYQEPTVSTASGPLSSFSSLTNPSGTQLLILALTVILAGIILIARIDWLFGRKETHQAAR